MVIVVNPYAGGGRAGRRWNAIKTKLFPAGNARTIAMDGGGSFTRRLRELVSMNESDFVAVGGDGTVNRLLNGLLDVATNDRVRLGAIGLGSSNDFHKPIDPETTLIDGIPCRLDFAKTSPRDVGCVRFEQEGTFVERYFLINASVGATAEGNERFNHPHFLLRSLKRFYTPNAIAYAALVTIARFRNLSVSLACADGTERQVSLSNLSIVKNPSVTGRLSYGRGPHFDDGLFQIYLSHGLTRGELLGLFLSLRHGKFPLSCRNESWNSNSVSVRGDTRFAVEFDGEVVRTRHAIFSIRRRFVEVCT